MFSFLKRKNTDPKAELRRVLSEFSLPSFPSVAMESLQRIRNPESSAGSIAEVLGMDPGLSVSVLRVANSPAFSPTRKIENLSQAIALVGNAQLESLILSVGVASVVPCKATPGYDSARFWQAAARRGILARELASVLCPARDSECFTAGFLQDLAIPFLARHKPKEYGAVLLKWHTTGGNLVELERAEFDWDHAEVATWICADWNLPEIIASAIGGHHAADDDDYDCPAPVALAAFIRETEETLGLDALAAAAQSRYGIDPERVDELVESSFAKAEDLARLLA
jgi:HD-like signal output (HDOD) protein